MAAELDTSYMEVIDRKLDEMIFGRIGIDLETFSYYFQNLDPNNPDQNSQCIASEVGKEYPIIHLEDSSLDEALKHLLRSKPSIYGTAFIFPTKEGFVYRKDNEWVCIKKTKPRPELKIPKLNLKPLRDLALKFPH